MECYKLVNGTLEPTTDPTDAFEDSSEDVPEMIRRAGYTVRVCGSELEDASGAEISIHETDKADIPRYYIELMGHSQGIATLVADNFPALLATLKELQPLVSLIGLDQRASIHLENRLARE